MLVAIEAIWSASIGSPIASAVAAIHEVMSEVLLPNPFDFGIGLLTFTVAPKLDFSKNAKVLSVAVIDFCSSESHLITPLVSICMVTVLYKFTGQEISAKESSITPCNNSPQDAGVLYVDWFSNIFKSGRFQY